MPKIAGYRSGIGSGSISQRHESTDQDPDPRQNVMIPQPASDIQIFKNKFLSMKTQKYIRLSDIFIFVVDKTLCCGRRSCVWGWTW
jgi:hypothetical protein